MTLNEAMRIGCQRVPEKRDCFVASFGACALGAIYVGLTPTWKGQGKDVNQIYTPIVTTFPELLYECQCPVRDCGDREREWHCTTLLRCSWLTGGPFDALTGAPRTIDVINHLHVKHLWSREAIAEWVDPRPELHVTMPLEEPAHANA